MTDYQLVARVASASSPNRAWDVKTDGRILTCACPSWTRRTHTAQCAEVRQQGACDCRRVTTIGPKTERTCRHTREIWRRVLEAGGLGYVLGLLSQGVTLSDSEAVARASAARPASEDLLLLVARRVREQGPDRVVVDRLGATGWPDSAPRAAEVVFIRADGWALGAPLLFAEVARRVSPGDWVGTMRALPGRTGPGRWVGPEPYTGQPFAPLEPPVASRPPYTAPHSVRRTCIHCDQPTNRPGRECQRVACVRARLGASACRVARCTHPRMGSGADLCVAHQAAAHRREQPETPAGAPEWLGGRRAILLRD